MLREAARNLRGETAVETIYFVLFDETGEGIFKRAWSKILAEPAADAAGAKARDAARGLLADRIRRFGPLTFADYMRECLYHPIHGYYSKPEAKRFADYYTNADVHPIFGRLLARQFAEMWEHLDRPEKFMFVEAGAGVGRLASHILDFSAQNFPIFIER